MGGAGLTCGPSDDGGFDELDEFWLSLASRSATRAVRAATCASHPTTIADRRAAGMWCHRSDGMDGGRVIPDNGLRTPRRSSRTQQAVNGYPPAEHLKNLKLILEVGVVLVTLIGGLIALLVRSR